MFSFIGAFLPASLLFSLFPQLLLLLLLFFRVLLFDNFCWNSNFLCWLFLGLLISFLCFVIASFLLHMAVLFQGYCLCLKHFLCDLRKGRKTAFKQILVKLVKVVVSHLDDRPELHHKLGHVSLVSLCRGIFLLPPFLRFLQVVGQDLGHLKSIFVCVIHKLAFLPPLCALLCDHLLQLLCHLLRLLRLGHLDIVGPDAVVERSQLGHLPRLASKTSPLSSIVDFTHLQIMLSQVS